MQPSDWIIAPEKNTANAYNLQQGNQPYYLLTYTHTLVRQTKKQGSCSSFIFVTFARIGNGFS